MGLARLFPLYFPLYTLPPYCIIALFVVYYRWQILSYKEIALEEQVKKKYQKWPVALHWPAKLRAKELQVLMARQLGRDVKLNELIEACIALGEAHPIDLMNTLNRGGGEER